MIVSIIVVRIVVNCPVCDALLGAELVLGASGEDPALLEDADCDVACGGGDGEMSEKLMLDIDMLENDRLLVGSAACRSFNTPCRRPDGSTFTAQICQLSAHALGRKLGLTCPL